MSEHCLVARGDGELLAAIRYTPITIGGNGGRAAARPPGRGSRIWAGAGIGVRLIRESLVAAKERGCSLRAARRRHEFITARFRVHPPYRPDRSRCPVPPILRGFSDVSWLKAMQPRGGGMVAAEHATP